MRKWILIIPFLLSCSRDVGFRYLPVENAPTARVETYRVKEIVTNPVDILWVVDNSGSMDDDINNVSVNIPSFIDQFIKVPGANWKMGLISTDYSQPPFLGFTPAFDVNTSTPTTVFQGALKALVAGGSDSEEMYRPIMAHLNANPNFLRAGADLAIIVVTDEDEQSYNIDVKAFETFLSKLPNPPRRVLAFGVMATYSTSCYGFQYPGSRYEEFMSHFNGRMYDLCSQNFGNELMTVSQDIVQMMEKRRIVLTRVPRPGTLKVLHRGNEIPSGPDGYWIYDPEANALEILNMDFATSDLEEVSVIYEPYS